VIQERKMIGAIAGDIIGSVFEWHNVKSTRFDLFSSGSTFTDDTVMTVAVAASILHNRDYSRVLKEYGRKFPHRGYGGKFREWLHSGDYAPYNSYGNGSAMRVSPVGFAFDTLEEVLKEAERSAEVTHNHPEGIKGAQAVAAAIFLARTGESKESIKKYIIEKFKYDFHRSIQEMRPTYEFDETCPGSVPQAITAFLESTDYENAIRLAVSLGGDSDTIACIAGGIAQAYYQSIPEHIVKETRRILDTDLLSVVELFQSRYGC
jgi:ADP-ribosylglycohydrolase